MDVGEHMQPYLPLLHRMVFGVLTGKLLSKPNHEVAVVLYGTKGTRHKLYDPNEQSYPHVTVLRPLQNLSSHLDLAPFAFASDPSTADGDAAADGGDGGVAPAEADQADVEAAAAGVLARMEATGAACGGAGADAAAAAARAAALFRPPGPKADWCDGLVVGLDLLATALSERFEKGKPEAGKAGAVRLLLVSNLLAESEPLDDDFRRSLVDTCHGRSIRLEVACLDHYVPPPPPPPAEQGQPAGSASAAVGSLAGLPAGLAAARRGNLEQLHLLKSELGPGAFSHLRQPAELLCLFRAKEVALQASNAIFKLTPGPAPGDEDPNAPPAMTLGVKLYKKIRRAHVEEFKSVLELPPGATGPPAGGDDDGSGGGFGLAGGPLDPGFVREVEYEDPSTGEKFPREEVVKAYLYGKQAVPMESYLREYLEAEVEQLRLLREKDLSLLGFVELDAVPRSRMIDEPHVMLGDSPGSAAAIAALALALQDKKQAGIVRFLIRKDTPSLAALLPHLSPSPDLPHCLLLCPLPFAEDLRPHPFSTFASEQEARDLPALLAAARGEEPPPPAQEAAPQPRAPTQGGRGGGGGPSQLSLSPLGELMEGVGGEGGGGGEPVVRYEKLQPSADELQAAMDLVVSLDLGPLGPAAVAAQGLGAEPYGEALAPEASANPHLHRTYALVASRALDPRAQLPHPEDDPLVETLLLPHGRYWPPGASEALRRAEELLQTVERPDGGGPLAKRPRRESGAEAAAEEAEGGEVTAGGGSTADQAPAAAQVVFDPSSAGGTSVRVVRVGELSPVEDFWAMLAQGGDSAGEAMSQMPALVRELVGRSIGDQLYDKAAQCVTALRAGCLATGRAGAFNSFLRDMAERCDRPTFLSRLAAKGLTLISTADLVQQPVASQPPGLPAGALTFSDDGGAVEPPEARAFLQRHTAAAEAAEGATGEAGAGGSLAPVLHDEEFEDMD
ncbi:hypothetical protein GPECTOR_1g154 [Gonium pectorale]|uniref:Ku domain-containing protein n=1 Tax=Gonium pectorale TaxID=33097 RepID=A0A150H212_GONPE|nr:hypothetical protein GPECTOR_1g154 [Gonium pectorale]|eukprot:KXZ56179.1 hypothetical protein GPECTOR_1g154 [Gonium pectorale]